MSLFGLSKSLFRLWVWAEWARENGRWIRSGHANVYFRGHAWYCLSYSVILSSSSSFLYNMCTVLVLYRLFPFFFLVKCSCDSGWCATIFWKQYKTEKSAYMKFQIHNFQRNNNTFLAIEMVNRFQIVKIKQENKNWKIFWSTLLKTVRMYIFLMCLIISLMHKIIKNTAVILLLFESNFYLQKEIQQEKRTHKWCTFLFNFIWVSLLNETHKDVFCLCLIHLVNFFEMKNAQLFLLSICF